MFKTAEATQMTQMTQMTPRFSPTPEASRERLASVSGRPSVNALYSVRAQLEFFLLVKMVPLYTSAIWTRLEFYYFGVVISPNSSFFVCYVSRPQLCVPDGRLRTVECETRSLLRNRVHFGSTSVPWRPSASTVSRAKPA